MFNFAYVAGLITQAGYVNCELEDLNGKRDRLCGLVVRVLGYGGPASIPGTTGKKSSGSGTGSTQPREYN
jgi:hypothetical protein